MGFVNRWTHDRLCLIGMRSLTFGNFPCSGSGDVRSGSAHTRMLGSQEGLPIGVVLQQTSVVLVSRPEEFVPRAGSHAILRVGIWTDGSRGRRVRNDCAGILCDESTCARESSFSIGRLHSWV